MAGLSAPRGATEFDGLMLREVGEVREKVARAVELVERVNGDFDGLTTDEQAELELICGEASRALKFISGSVSINLMHRRQSRSSAE